MTITKERALDKTQVLSIVNGFLNQFQTCCNQQKTPKLSDFEKYLSENFQISSNGRLSAKNLKDYLSRIESFQKKYANLEISILNEECVTADNKLVVRYNVSLTTHSQQKILMNIMAMATFENHIITRWSQVAHYGKGLGH